MEPVAINAKPEIERLERERQETLSEIERLKIDLHNLAEPTADDADLDAYEREKTWEGDAQGVGESYCTLRLRKPRRLARRSESTWPVLRAPPGQEKRPL